MRTHLNRPSVAVSLMVAVAGFAAVPAAGLAQVSVTAIPVVLGGTNPWSASLSADGNYVVGSFGSANFQSHGFRWSPSSGLLDLGAGTAIDVSADGSVITGSGGRWTQAGGWESIGFAGNAISDDGTTIIGLGLQTRRWTVGSPSGGVVVGTTSIGNVGLWHMSSTSVSADGMRYVGSLPPGFVAEGNTARTLFVYYSSFTPAGISADGSMIAARINGQSVLAQYATVSTFPIQTYLPNIDPLGLSGDGRVVTGMVLPAGSSMAQAGFWAEDIGSVTLVDYLTQYGADLTGWSNFYNLSGVSYDGRTITGMGVYQGVNTPFYITGVPTPGAAALIGLGSLAMARRRR